MGHQALSVIQTLCLGHREVGLEQIFQCKDLGIHNAALSGGALADVTAEPYRLAILHLCNCSLFQLFDRQIDISYLTAFCNVAQVLYGVASVVRLVRSRRIDQADVII